MPVSSVRVPAIEIVVNWQYKDSERGTKDFKDVHDV